MNRKAFIFLGPPGSGKGTASKILIDEKGCQQLSTGDMLRDEIKKESEIGKEVKEILNRGDLVNDELIIKIVEGKIKDPAKKAGAIIFDGFPRTVTQAKKLEEMLKSYQINLVNAVLIDATLNLIVKRITERRVCPGCKHVYNLTTLPSKKGEQCENCDTLLIQRSDDTEEKVANRYNVYQKQTEPLLDYYKDKLVSVDGKNDIRTVADDIIKVLNL